MEKCGGVAIFEVNVMGLFGVSFRAPSLRYYDRLPLVVRGGRVDQLHALRRKCQPMPVIL